MSNTSLGSPPAEAFDQTQRPGGLSLLEVPIDGEGVDKWSVHSGVTKEDDPEAKQEDAGSCSSSDGSSCFTSTTDMGTQVLGRRRSTKRGFPLGGDTGSSAPAETPPSHQQKDSWEGLMPRKVEAVVAPLLRAMYYSIYDRLSEEHNRRQNPTNVHSLMLLSRCERRVNGQGGIPAVYLKKILQLLHHELLSGPGGAGIADKAAHYQETIDHILIPPASPEDSQDEICSPTRLRTVLKAVDPGDLEKVVPPPPIVKPPFSPAGALMRPGVEQVQVVSPSRARVLPQLSAIEDWIDFSVYESVVSHCAISWSQLHSLRCENLPHAVQRASQQLHAFLLDERKYLEPTDISRERSSVAHGVGGKRETSPIPDGRAGRGEAVGEIEDRSTTSRKRTWLEQFNEELRTNLRPNSASRATQDSEASLEAVVEEARGTIDGAISTTEQITQQNPREYPHDYYRLKWDERREMYVSSGSQLLNASIENFKVNTDRIELEGEQALEKGMAPPHGEAPKPACATRGKKQPATFLQRRTMLKSLEKLRDERVARLQAARRAGEGVSKIAEKIELEESIQARRWVKDRNIGFPTPAPARAPIEFSRPGLSLGGSAGTRAVKHTAATGRSSSGSKGLPMARSPMPTPAFNLYRACVEDPTEHFILTAVPSTSERPVESAETASTTRPPTAMSRRLKQQSEHKVECWRPKNQEERRGRLAKGIFNVVEEIPHSKYPDRNGNASLSEAVVARRKRTARHYAILVEAQEERASPSKRRETSPLRSSVGLDELKKLRPGSAYC